MQVITEVQMEETPEATKWVDKVRVIQPQAKVK
jgi:hypothetical protein